MSTSFTRTDSFTITNARYVTSKIKADLKLFQRAYGRPSDSDIEAYGEEAAQLLAKGYLRTVTYGYRRNGSWIVAMSYTARNDGSLASDDRAGQIPRRVNTTGASFYSYLTYSTTWDDLTSAEKEAFQKTLPITRSGAPEPGTSGGYWSEGRTYSSHGSGVNRRTFQSW